VIHLIGQKNICIVTSPIRNTQESYYYLLCNFIKIIEHICGKVIVVTGNFQTQDFFRENITIKNIKYTPSKFIVLKILQYAILQIKIILNLFKLRKNYSVGFILSGTLFMPTVFLSLLGKKAVLTAVASQSNCIKYKSRKNFKDIIYYIVLSIMEKISFKYAYKIGFESPSVSSSFNVQNYTDKLYSGNIHINDGSFRKITNLSAREYDICYLGRLSEEKGVLNFVKAIPIVLTFSKNINILIGGNGPLESVIRKYLIDNKIGNKLQIMGWIPREELPKYLNQIKLIVMPSYTEGLPNLLLEAMACGTIVVATPVGGIPDVIKDETTGFLLDKNSPECIAETILKVLNMPVDKLEKVSDNARAFVEKEFTFEAAVKRWSEIMEGI